MAHLLSGLLAARTLFRSKTRFLDNHGLLLAVSVECKLPTADAVDEPFSVVLLNFDGNVGLAEGVDD